MNAAATAACAVTICTSATLFVGLLALEMPAIEASTSKASGLGHLVGYAEGAPAGFSGGFGEQSCHACHFHAEINSGPGRVAITGVPQGFVGGERYPITATLSRPGMALGGFQLTIRFKDGGAQAGTLAPAPGEEERIGIDVQNGIHYASQRHKGAAPVAPDTGGWVLLWTAPQRSAPVVLHVAANAADGDERVDGDYIHTATAETTPAYIGAGQ